MGEEAVNSKVYFKTTDGEYKELDGVKEIKPTAESTKNNPFNSLINASVELTFTVKNKLTPALKRISRDLHDMQIKALRNNPNKTIRKCVHIYTTTKNRRIKKKQRKRANKILFNEMKRYI